MSNQGQNPKGSSNGFSVPSIDDLDVVGFSEQVEHEWNADLECFMKDVWPMFRKYGISRDAAYMSWLLNQINNRLTKLTNVIEEGHSFG